MNSKQALKKINQYWADMNVLEKSDIVLSNEDWESVYKDLEVLEILKKHYDVNSLIVSLNNFISFCIYNDDKDFNKIKEWLENE